MQASPTATFGASRPLRCIPAIVSFLNPQPTLSLVGGNRSSCPKADPCPSSEHSLEAAIRDSAEPLHSRGAGQAAVALLSCGKSGFPLPPIVIKLWREGKRSWSGSNGPAVYKFVARRCAQWRAPLRSSRRPYNRRHQTRALRRKAHLLPILPPRAQASRRCETQASLGGKPPSSATVSVP